MITVRVEAADASFGADTAVLDLLEKSVAESGLVALAVTPTDGDTLKARAKNEQITLDAYDSVRAVSGINELLERAGIVISHGNLDWEI